MSIKIKELTLSKASLNLSQNYKSLILDNLSVEFSTGGFHLIIGESGSGKTTLLNCIYSVEKNYSGIITLNNIDIKNFQKEIKYLFQYNGELLNPFREVKSMLEDGMTNNLKIKKQSERAQIIENYLSDFQLDKKVLIKKGFQLSGGEHQRVALIRLLISNPNILLLDEPFSSQDIEANKIIADNLITLNKNKKVTIICVSHNLSNIIKHVDTISILHRGKILESGTGEFILSNATEELTKNLINGNTAELNGSAIN